MQMKKLFYFTMFLCLCHIAAKSQTELVMPGDADKNGVVDYNDYMIITHGWGLFGSPRPNGNTEFNYQTVTSWSFPAINGVNLAHLDCNGDGTINGDDLKVVTKYYGISYINTYVEPQTGTVTDPPFVLRLTSYDDPTLTQYFTVALGNSSLPYNNFHGIVFDIELPSSYEANNFYIEEMPNSWIRSSGISTVLYSQRISPTRHRIVYSITDNFLDGFRYPSGGNEILRGHYIYEDNLIGISATNSNERITIPLPSILNLYGGKLIAQEQPVNILPVEVLFYLGIEDIIPFESVKMTTLNGFLNIENHSTQKIFVRLNDMHGKQILQIPVEETSNKQVPISSISSGIYMAICSDKSGKISFSKKLFISKP